MKITVFTPTYNRGYIIAQLYDSLRRQTSKEFEWIVIDDGSTDDTETLVRHWTETETDFEIRYFKTANGGKQRAINRAVQWAKYDYFFIVDSDDALLPDAVECIATWGEACRDMPRIAAVSGVRQIAGRPSVKLTNRGGTWMPPTWSEADTISRTIWPRHTRRRFCADIHFPSGMTRRSRRSVSCGTR